MIKVVAALIKKDNKVLIARRATGGKEVLGKWEFPGGKVENGETEEEAIEREIREEFNLTIKANKYLTNNECKYPNITIDLRLYECEYLEGKFELHDHSEYKWVDIKELLKLDLAPADIPLAEYVMKKQANDDKNPNQKFNIENLIVGNIYTNDEIAKTFKCSNMGGMRRSKETNSLVLIVKHNNPLYDDKWTDKGVLNYTGMGMIGNQNINFAQNKTLASAKENGIKVYLFESYKDNEYYYNGEVELCGEIYTAKEYDAKGNLREVLKYPLKLKENDKMIFIKEENLKSSIQLKEKEAKKLSNEELKKSALQIENNSYSKEIITTYRERNVIVSQYTKRRANGYCDLCNNEAPFKNKNGEPYLESHHIITLAEGGPDVIYNTVALCPNCHRRIHALKEKKDIKKLVNKVYQYVQEENNEKQTKEFIRMFKNINK